MKQTFKNYIMTATTRANKIKALKNEINEIMYLDYVNNFITLARFAEHYNISEKEAENIIDGVRDKLKNK